MSIHPKFTNDPFFQASVKPAQASLAQIDQAAIRIESHGSALDAFYQALEMMAVREIEERPLRGVYTMLRCDPIPAPPLSRPTWPTAPPLEGNVVIGSLDADAAVPPPASDYRGI